MSKAAQSLIVQQTNLPEKRAQKAGLEKEAAPLSGAKTKCSKVRRNLWFAGKGIYGMGKLRPLDKRGKGEKKKARWEARSLSGYNRQHVQGGS